MMSQYAAMQGYRDQLQNPAMSAPHFPMNSGAYRNQQQMHQQQQQFMNQQFSSMYGNQAFNQAQNQAMMMNSMTGGNPMFPRGPTPQGQSSGQGSQSVHPPPHPHLRQGIHQQNPQQVADNILQMASSTYSAQTVQVPLNKGRSAPYHNPRTNYNMANQQNSPGLPSNMGGMQPGVPMPPGMSGMMPMHQHQQGMGNMQGSGGRQVMQPQGSPSRLSRSGVQYNFPNSSPHPHQPRTSPISPMQLHSPASQHSTHSIHNPSPGPLQSPAGSNIRSPVSPNMIGGGMQSPCAKQAQMPSPTPSQPMRSPLQHMKHINSPMMNCTPNPSPGNHIVNSSMRSPHTPSQLPSPHPPHPSPHPPHPSPHPPHPSPHPQHYPHIQQASLPQNLYSPAPQSINSPHPSHTSSPPYAQSGGRISPPLSSPHSMASKPSPSGSTGSASYSSHPPPSTLHKLPMVNPLQSLQKLVMLPETQVVDPKSVVNDACLSSPTLDHGIDVSPKNCDISTDSVPSQGSQLENKCSEGKPSAVSAGHIPKPQPAKSDSFMGICTEPSPLFDKTPVYAQKTPVTSQEQQLPNIKSTTQNTVGTSNQETVKELDCVKSINCDQVVSTGKDVLGQNRLHVPDSATPNVNSSVDNKQGNENKDIKKPKQENMSPKKRFLGSQPMLNGNKSSPISEVTSNGPDKVTIDTNKTTPSSICPWNNDTTSVITNNVNQSGTVNEISNSETYLSKKLKKKRISEKPTAAMKVGVIASGDSAVVPSGNGTCAVSSVIQVTPHFGATVYDDVSDPSDLEEGELSVRKDSKITYTREGRDSLNNSFSSIKDTSRSYTNNDSDSDSLDYDGLVLPFQNASKFMNSNINHSEFVKSKTSSDSINVSHQNDFSFRSESLSPVSNDSVSPFSEDELDAIVSPAKKRKRTLNSKSKSKSNSQCAIVFGKESKPLSTDRTLDSGSSDDDDEPLSMKLCRRSSDLGERPMSPGEISWSQIQETPIKTTQTGSKTFGSEKKPASRSLVDNSKSKSTPRKGDTAQNDTSNETNALSGSPRLRTKRKSTSEGVVNDAPSNTEKNNSSSGKPLSHSPPSKVIPKKRPKKWKSSSANEKEDMDLEPQTDKMDPKEEEELVPAKEEMEEDQNDSLNVSVLASTSEFDFSTESKHLRNTRESSHRKRRGRPPGSKNKVKREKRDKRSKHKSDKPGSLSEDDKSSKSSKKALQMLPPPGIAVKKRRDMVGANSGPFIRVVGPRENPDKYVIMNALLEDSETKPAKKKPSVPSSNPSSSMSIQISNLPSDKSVLVGGLTPSDETLWYCCICRKHSSYKFLGDLFGPYYPEGYQPASAAEDGSDKPKQRRKKMFVLADQVPNYAALMKPVKGKKQAGEKKQSLSPPFELASGAMADSDELWVHEDCVLWSDGVYLIQNNIYGLQEAANIAATSACSSCHEVGASIGCLHKGCSQKYHYVCAVEKDCYLDEENFSLLCLKHKEKRLKVTDQSSRKVS